MLHKRKLVEGGGKRLVKGAALSSFLTAVLAGISSPSFAENQTIDKITNSSVSESNDSGSLIVDGNSGDSGDLDAIRIENKQDVDISLKTKGSADYDIILDADKGYGIRTQDGEESSTGTILLDASGNNEINAKVHGISSDSAIDIILKAGKDNNITVSGNGSDGDGINVTEGNVGSISLTAKESNKITVETTGSDGIYTNSNENEEKYSSGDISLLAEGVGNDVGNIIEAGNNGIDHRGGQEINLIAESGANIIKAGVNNKVGEGDGIRLAGTGTVSLSGSFNKIEANDAGIYIASSVNGLSDTEDNNIDVIASTSGNKITGSRNGIQADSEDNTVTVNIAAKAGDNVISASEEFSEDSFGHGIVTHGANIRVTANEGKNIISGTKNAVYNSGAGVITISAVKDESSGISLLTDYVNYDNALTAGENGVASDGTGTTNVIADNNNYIYGTNNGILSTNGIINVTAGNDNIIGQYIDENNAIHTSQISVNVISGGVDIYSGNNTYLYGINKAINNEGNIKIEGEGNIRIEGSGGSNTQTIYNKGENAEVNIIGTSGKDILIVSKGKNSSSMSSGIVNDGGKVNILTGHIKINSLNGVMSQAVFNSSSDTNGIITLNGDSVEIKAESSSIGYGIFNKVNSNQKQVVDIDSASYTSISSTGINGRAIFHDGGCSKDFTAEVKTTIDSRFDNIISGTQNAIRSEVSKESSSEQISLISINSTLGSNNIAAENEEAVFIVGGKVSLSALNSYNKIEGKSSTAVYAKGDASTAELNASYNELVAAKYGISTESTSKVNMIATSIEGNDSEFNGRNFISAKDNGINVENTGSLAGGDYFTDVSLTASTENIITSEKIAINAVGDKAHSTLGTVAYVKLSSADNVLIAKTIGINTSTETTVSLDASLNNNIQAGDVSEDFYGTGSAINAISNSEVSLNAEKLNLLSGSVSAEGQGTVVNIKGEENAIYFLAKEGDGKSVVAENGAFTTISSETASDIEVISEKGSAIGIHALTNGVVSSDDQSTPDVEESIGSLYVTATSSSNLHDDESIGIFAGNNLPASSGTVSFNVIENVQIVAKADVASATAIKAQSDSFVELLGQNSNIYAVSNGKADTYGIWADSMSNAQIESTVANEIIANSADKTNNKGGFGNGYAVYSTSGSSVTLEAGNFNQLQGAVYANGNGTNVFIGNIDESFSRLNVVQSYAYIKEAGDLDKDTTEGEASFKEKNVISALYAEEGANITLSGMSNRLYTTANPEEHNDLERVVWAYNGGSAATTISIDGHTDISTDQYDKSLNSIDIAIAAGTAVNLDEQLVNASKDMAVEDRAQVIVDYADLVDENGNTIASSSITGDILAAYQGYVDIKPNKDSDAGIDITGNILAGNNGIVNINLGKEGSLTGRADDYGDAGVIENSEHTKFFNPAFSSVIHEGGAVNLTMGEGSRWDVTGQSWITSVNTGIFDSTADDVSCLPTIDLTRANNMQNSAAAGLTVYDFNGDANFKMKLDGNNLDNSNMLYMKHANGNYYIELENAVSADEINTELHDGLRFATVGKESNVHFSVGSRDDGAFDVEYEVGQDYYDYTVEENERYNGTQLGEQKPGDSTVKEFFGNDGTPVEEVSGEPEIATANAFMALAEEAEVNAVDSQQDSATGAVNHKIIAVKSREISDGGKTIINMSRANYANAVYMDTLNKRQGEARFVGDTDHGVWVRLRHDNIGKDDSFRTHNTMVEVGFEQRDVNDYGEFHTGFALDYMNGQIDYHTVDGDGDIERYGVWFYTTYLGNDGQYADLVLKYGHLKNDFGFNTKSQGEHVTGDYTNEVASISAEYGWKFSNSYNYYIEPQMQLQYSYVTGADYTTSQGSKVDLDSIHSLIGRVGFRAGKDFNTETPVTLYARADVLHEFLGDQDIYAYDNTGVMDVTYENDDTWYSAGVGLSVQSSENTYFFIEGEQVFGADNDSTYTVSGGFKHSF